MLLLSREAAPSSHSGVERSAAASSFSRRRGRHSKLISIGGSRAFSSRLPLGVLPSAALLLLLFTFTAAACVTPHW